MASRVGLTSRATRRSFDDAVARKLPFGAPLALDTTHRVEMGPSLSNPIMSADSIELARWLVGTASFMCTTARLDGLFAFVTLSQNLGARLTRSVLRAIFL